MTAPDDSSGGGKTCPVCERAFTWTRKRSSCVQCHKVVCSACMKHAPESASKASKREHCSTCVTISACDADVRQSLYCSTLAPRGQSQQFPGISVELYREWFSRHRLLPKPQGSAEKQRMRIVDRLQLQHVLHCAEWKALCANLCSLVNAPAAFVSIVDRDHELIVASAGSLVDFSNFPRKVSMCDPAIAHSGVLCIADVGSHRLFQANPMLKAIHAQAYVAVPVYVNNVAVATIAVIDTQARLDFACVGPHLRLKSAARVVAQRIAMFTTLMPASSPARSLRRKLSSAVGSWMGHAVKRRLVK